MESKIEKREQHFVLRYFLFLFFVRSVWYVGHASLLVNVLKSLMRKIWDESELDFFSFYHDRD